MTRRRNNHEGTIFQLASGKWRAQVAIGGRRLGYTAKTRQECSKWVRDTYIQVQKERRKPKTHMTYREYLEEWLVGMKSSIKDTTFSHYSYLAKNHILPALGEINLAELDPSSIQALYNEKVKAGYGARTVQVMHIVIHHSLDQAIKLRLIDINPDDATRPPKNVQKEMKFYNEDQVAQLLIAAAGSRNEALYYIALYTGMRQAEILGLCWSDVDWKKKSIHVQRQLKRNFSDGELFTSPKSSAGYRTILLGQNGITQLQNQWQMQLQERVDTGKYWRENNLIFPSRVGTPMDHSNLLKDFYRIISLAGLPRIRFHDLRHSSASLMLNHGIPPLIASKRLGHKRVSITLDTYGHLISEMQNEAADLLDELVTPPSIKLHTTAHEIENVQTG